MKMLPFLALGALVSGPGLAETTRQLDAHEHGVGQLNIALDGNEIAMEFHAPGADIVGFEYAATSAQDRAAVDGAVATLARPLNLFAIPQDAGCSVVQASAALESEDDHDDHEGEDHADHDDDDHNNTDHDDHADHADHAEKVGHTEFHANYLLTCADPDAITSITFAYFDTFTNAQEVEVQIIWAGGATAFEVERAAPVLDLRGMF